MTTGTALSGAWAGPRPWHPAPAPPRPSGRKVPDAVTLLRLVLAYCLGQWSLRSTAAWAAAAGFADISNVGLLYRLRRCGDWLALLVGHVLANHAPKLGHSLPRRRPGAG